MFLYRLSKPVVHHTVLLYFYVLQMTEDEFLDYGFHVSDDPLNVVVADPIAV